MTTAAEHPTGTAAERPPLREAILRVLRSATLQAVGGAILIAGLVILVRSQGWLQPAELLVYDKLRVAWSPRVLDRRFLLIGMTEPDIHRWNYPFNDEVMAAVLERIASAHPRVIGVDIYRDIPVPPGTDKLFDVLKKHPEIIWIFKLKEGNGKRHPMIPPPAALKGTEQVALADVPIDPGNVARRGLLYADDGTNSYPSLGLALALAYLKHEKITPEAGPNDSLKLGKAVFPPLDDDRGPYVKLDDRGYQILLDYGDGARPFHRESVGSLMDNDLSRMIRDRVVIVGNSLESVKDVFGTPFSTGFSTDAPDYGMEIHAHLAKQLIDMAQTGEKMLTGLPRLGEDGWILAWAFAGAILGLTIRSGVKALGIGAAGITAMGGGVYVAFGYGLLLPALPAVLAWGAAAALTNQVLYAASNRARARLRDSFGHYLPPTLIEEMLKGDAIPHLGGERREIAVLFTDIAGFTTFSEAMDPADLAVFTNEYFDGVCAAIFKHGGNVNAYIGDSVLAFFGAPVQQEDRADRAIAAALDIDRFTTRFKADLAARGIDFGHTRVGLHNGVAFVGNIGTDRLMRYTALGDVLNTGSRLEGLNKAIGTHICCSAEIMRMAQKHTCRPVGAFVVKGRHGATEVFTPVDSEIHSLAWVRRYEEAFRAAEECLPEALDLFTAMHAEDPHDACVSFHYHRLVAGEIGTHIHMDEK